MFGKGMRLGAIVFFGVFLAAETGSSAEPPAPPKQTDFLAANLDSSVSPGNDFFQYANGGWLKRNPIPPTESIWGIDSLVRDEVNRTLRDINTRMSSIAAQKGSEEQKIGDFWVTAMDIEKAQRLGIRPLRQELARIDAVRNLSQMLDAAFALHRLDVNVFFRFLVAQDKKNSDTVAVYVYQGGLGLPDRDFYLNSDQSIEHIRSEYVAHIVRVLRLIGRSDAAARIAAANVMGLETALARASRKLEDTRDPLTNYHRMRPDDLSLNHTPSIEWSSRLAAWNLHADYMIVGQPEYFDALDRALRQTSLPVLKDYLRFQLVSKYAEYLSPAFEAEDFRFNHYVLAGEREQQPRWQRVLDAESPPRISGFAIVAGPIGMMVGRRYVTAQFSEAAKQRYSLLAEAIAAAYRERIRRLDWMSDVTKVNALEKLAAMKRQIGYPDRWLDYSALSVARGSYCDNMMRVARWRFDHMLDSFGKPIDRTEWSMTPQTYSAYYNVSNNEIVLPAAIFSVPGVADSGVDDAVAYGYVGAFTIGHEITHGFDSRGRKYDAKGNLADWWTVADAAQFDKRAEVMIRQFDAFEPLAGFHINGKATLSENIADHGGVLLALDAFKKTEQYHKGEKIAGLTPIQRFFLGYAYGSMIQARDEYTRQVLLSNQHAPDKWRVLGPLSNVPEFYEAFDVAPNQAMWRPAEDRVNIW